MFSKFQDIIELFKSKSFHFLLIVLIGILCSITIFLPFLVYGYPFPAPFTFWWFCIAIPLDLAIAIGGIKFIDRFILPDLPEFDYKEDGT